MNCRACTLGELVEYVLKYRKGNVFKDCEERIIASGIKHASDEGTLLYLCRDDGSICGLIVCFNNEPKKEMFVRELLTTERWVLPEFVHYFRQKYPEHTLVARRRDKDVVYKTDRLCQKLMKGTN